MNELDILLLTITIYSKYIITLNVNTRMIPIISYFCALSFNPTCFLSKDCNS